MLVIESLQLSPLETSFALGLLTSFVLFFCYNSSTNTTWSKYPNLYGDIKGQQKRAAEFIKDSRGTYREGYRKFKSAVYRLTTTDHERLILPTKYLDELRDFPDDELSIVKAMDTVLEAKLTKLDPNNAHLSHAVRADLTPKLAALTPRVRNECARVMTTELPACDDWTPVTLHHPFLRMVAIVSGNVFMGPELCKREEYIHASMNYTVDVFDFIEQIKKWHRALRWLGAIVAPERRRTIGHEKRAEAFLAPVIEQRRRLMRGGEALPDDMIQWMLNKADKFGDPDDAQMAHLQLVLSTASIHTTTTALMNIVYDIVAEPGLVDALRAEARDVLSQHDNAFTMKALYDMKLLDSVMKESQRCNSFNFTRFTRVALKPLTLRDGTFIPAGTYLEIPTDAIGRDPELYPDPDRFDAWRFYNLRRAGGQHLNRHQFVTVTKEDTNFGWGRHACPGRFFAANEIKLLVANLLLRFEIKMKDEDVGKGRFKNWEGVNANVPDVTKELLLRRIK